MSTAAPAVGVIGGGIAGVAAARLLAHHGLKVSIYEQHGRLGGRLGGAGLLAGAGTTYISFSYVAAKHPQFARTMEGWRDAGAAHEWDAGVPHTLASPFRGARDITPTPEVKKEGVQWMTGAPDMGALAALTPADQRHVTVRCPSSPSPGLP